MGCMYRAESLCMPSGSTCYTCLWRLQKKNARLYSSCFALLVEWRSGIKKFFGLYSVFNLTSSCFCCLFYCHDVLLVDAAGRCSTVLSLKTNWYMNDRLQDDTTQLVPWAVSSCGPCELHGISTCWITYQVRSWIKLSFPGILEGENEGNLTTYRRIKYNSRATRGR